jgi:hypothetical protein
MSRPEADEGADPGIKNIASRADYNRKGRRNNFSIEH